MAHLLSRRHVLAAMGATAAVGATMRPAMADGLLAKVKAAGVLKIGIADNIPWSRLNTDGTMSGIAPMTVEAVAKRLGIPKVEGIVGSYAQLIPGLLAGRWDMIGASLIITPARCEQVIFTDPFYRDSELHDWAIWVPGSLKEAPKTFIDMAKQFDTIGMPAGAMVPYMQKTIAATGSKAQIIQFNDSQLLVEGIKTKRVPIGTLDNASAKLLQKQMGGFDGAPVDSGVPYRGSGGAFRKEDRDFRDAFVVEQRAVKASGDVVKFFKQYDYVYDEAAMKMSGDEACALPDPV